MNRNSKCPCNSGLKYKDSPLFGTHISSDMGLGVLGALLSLKGKKRKF